jgi:hypothetical protein
MTDRQHLLLPLAVLLAAGCAGAKPDAAAAPDEVELVDPAGVEPDIAPPEATPVEQAEFDDEAQLEKEPLLDRTQRTVDSLVLGTARRVDNLFGSTGVEEEASITRGRLSVGGQWDQRDGFRSRFRLRARYRLPALSERTALLLGRGDADDLIDGSGDDNVDTLPNRFNDFEDEDWLLGIGYSRDAMLRRGWSFGGGVRIALPLEPFVRATYRWNRNFGDQWLWRVEPRVFVQSQRGAGVSFQNTVDYAASQSWLFRSWSIGVVEEEVDGLSWTSKLIAYHNLNRKSAFSYAVYGVGETQFEVPLKDYGIELRYRRQIAREWLFIELLGRLNWPREFVEEVRESNWGVGIEFELQFGTWPGRNRDPEAAQEARMRLRESESTLRPVVSNRAGMPGGWRGAGTSP